MLSPSTRAAYAADWRHWSSWCRGRGAAPVPIEPPLVATYVIDQAGAIDHRGSPRYRASTIARRVAALSWHAQTTGDRDPLARHPAVADALAEVRRDRNRSPRATAPLSEPELADVIAAMHHHTWPAGVAAARDTLVLLLGVVAHLSRSVAAGLTTADIALGPDGLRLVLPGGERPAPPAPSPLLCAPCAAIRWTDLLAAGAHRPEAMRLVLATGLPDVWEHRCYRPAARGHDAPAALLRPVDAAGAIASRPLTPGSLNRILKRRVAAASLDPTRYAFGSLSATHPGGRA